MGRPRLGEVLVARGRLQPEQLQSALGYQRKWGVPLGQVLVDQRFVAAREVLQVLAEQAGLRSVDLDAVQPDPALLSLVTRKVAQTHRVVPLRLEPDGTFVVAMAAPASLASVDAVRAVSRKRLVRPELALDAALDRAIARLYGGGADHLPLQPAASVAAIPMPEAGAAEPMEVDRGQAHGMPWAATAEALSDGSVPVLPPLSVGSEGGASVLVFGWGEAAGRALQQVLERDGLPAHVATVTEVYAAGRDAVVVAPLPALEALHGRLRAQVLAAGKRPESDLARAQAVGARGFVASPVDEALLTRAVRRLRRAAQEERAAGETLH